MTNALVRHDLATLRRSDPLVVVVRPSLHELLRQGLGSDVGAHRFPIVDPVREYADTLRPSRNAVSTTWPKIAPSQWAKQALTPSLDGFHMTGMGQAMAGSPVGWVSRFPRFMPGCSMNRKVTDAIATIMPMDIPRQTK